jgi:hypothetical protein
MMRYSTYAKLTTNNSWELLAVRRVTIVLLNYCWLRGERDADHYGVSRFTDVMSDSGMPKQLAVNDEAFRLGARIIQHLE